MSEIEAEKLQAFRKRYNDLIGEGILQGLLSPTAQTSIPGLGIHAKGRNYLQDGGDYTQATGGEHEQTGGGGYTQSAPTKVSTS